MAKYRCTICDYVYDESQGDPEHGVVPGTVFTDPPDSWVCPLCGVDKSAFVIVE